MKNITFAFAFCFSILCASNAFAHSALLNCYDNADNTFTCQGGYSDGSSATGIRIVVKSKSGNVLYEARLDSNSEVVIPFPKDKNFTVLFDGGSGHSVEITSNVLSR